MEDQERRLLQLEWEQSAVRETLKEMVDAAQASRHNLANKIQEVVSAFGEVRTNIAAIKETVEKQEERLQTAERALLTQDVQTKTRTKLYLGAGTGITGLMAWGLSNSEQTHKFLNWLDKIFGTR